MLLDTSQRRWIVGTGVAAGVATAAYLAYAASRLNGPSGGSWPGLTFGIVGFALMIYAGVLGARLGQAGAADPARADRGDL